MNDIFGTDAFFELDDFVKLVSRLGIDLAVALLVVYFIYYRKYRNRDFVFTFLILNLITFSMCMLLRKVPTELGFALGLFGVFGILRFRTEEIKARDLTYLFIFIGLAIINGIANKKVSAAELLVVNAAIVIITAALELPSRGNALVSTPMLYDKLDLLKPNMLADLHKDLGDRLGCEIVRVAVNRIDFLRDAAEVTVIYKREDASTKATPT